MIILNAIFNACTLLYNFYIHYLTLMPHHQSSVSFE